MTDPGGYESKAGHLLREVSGEARLDDVGFARLARRVRAQAEAAWGRGSAAVRPARPPVLAARWAALIAPIAVAAAAVVVAMGWGVGDARTTIAVPAPPSAPGSVVVSVFGVSAPENAGLLAAVSEQSADEAYLDALLGTANRANLLVASVRQ